MDRTVREWVQLAEQKGKHTSQTQGRVELGQYAELLRKLVGGWGIFLLSPQNEKLFFLHSRQECHPDQMSLVQC